MIEIDANDIRLYILIPVQIDDNDYQIIDPDVFLDQQFINQLVSRNPEIEPRHIPEIHQPLFLTEDFKAVFRPMGIHLPRANEDQSVQAVIPRMNIVVTFRWRFELMCNLGLLIFELELPQYTSMRQLEDLFEIIQLDSFNWTNGEGWLLPHHSITQLLDIPPNKIVGLSRLTAGFEAMLNVRSIIESQTPFVAFLLQMNLQGGNDFFDASEAFGEYLLSSRFRHLSSLFGYHENQEAYSGANWRCAQTLNTCAWFEWLPPKLSDSPSQYRHAAQKFYTSSMQRQRATRRIFKICTLDHTIARFMSHLLASKGEARRIRQAIQSLCRDSKKKSALANDILFKLFRLETRFILLNTNITNHDWVLDNPFGEGTNFGKLMGYMQAAYGTEAHISALRQQLDLFNQMLDRCL